MSKKAVEPMTGLFSCFWFDGFFRFRRQVINLFFMVFSDTTNKLGIIQACERYTALGDATISGTTQTLKEFTAHVNQHSRKVWHMIFMAYGGWQYDDGNQSDLPAATATLTSGQTSYALPTGALTIRGIEVKDTGNVWHQLKPITEEMIGEFGGMGEFFKTSGVPLYYQLVGQSIRVYPASNWTQASSWKVFFDRGSVAFANTDTTATPGFASEYHDILPIGASIEWLKINQPESTKLQVLRVDYAEYETKIKQFYTMRFQQMFPPRIRVRDALADAR